jgi:hypothetical protein
MTKFICRGYSRIIWLPYSAANGKHVKLEPVHLTDWIAELGGFDVFSKQSPPHMYIYEETFVSSSDRQYLNGTPECFEYVRTCLRPGINGHLCLWMKHSLETYRLRIASFQELWDTNPNYKRWQVEFEKLDN